MTVLECAKLLGETLAKDPVIEEFQRTKAEYEADPYLQNAMAEYKAQRMVLGRELAKDTAMQDAELIDTLQERIAGLTDKVNNAPSYTAYLAAQKAVTALMQKVNGEINFYAFGERPCTHDCSTCQADCASKK